MVNFVNKQANLLANHHRILTTGTTGWLLKLLFAADDQRAKYISKIRANGKETRLIEIFEKILGVSYTDSKKKTIEKQIESTKNEMDIRVNGRFSELIMPLQSGPEGGDVLIANEILKKTCHSIIFFQDPGTAHPHKDDIRLLEHTSQLPGIFAECVSDPLSAEKWVFGLKKQIEGGSQPNFAQELRERYALQDVVIVNHEEDHDSDELGGKLARVCAGYIDTQIKSIVVTKKVVRIGIAWGWGTKQVLKEIKSMADSGLITKPPVPFQNVIWSPLIGTITAEVTDSEASIIAQGFCDFYGGKVESFPCAGFAREETNMPGAVKELIGKLETADIILTSASPWDEKASLYKNTGLNSEYFPKLSESVGLISGIFLDANGKEVLGKYTTIGLGYKGFIKAAERGAVILMCGGEDRREILYSSLKARMVSTLITTSKTAKMLLKAI